MLDRRLHLAQRFSNGGAPGRRAEIPQIPHMLGYRPTRRRPRSHSPNDSRRTPSQIAAEAAPRLAASSRMLLHPPPHVRQRSWVLGWDRSPFENPTQQIAETPPTSGATIGNPNVASVDTTGRPSSARGQRDDIESRHEVNRFGPVSEAPQPRTSGRFVMPLGKAVCQRTLPDVHHPDAARGPGETKMLDSTNEVLQVLFLAAVSDDSDHQLMGPTRSASRADSDSIGLARRARSIPWRMTFVRAFARTDIDAAESSDTASDT